MQMCMNVLLLYLLILKLDVLTIVVCDKVVDMYNCYLYLYLLSTISGMDFTPSDVSPLLKVEKEDIGAPAHTLEQWTLIHLPSKDVTC